MNYKKTLLPILISVTLSGGISSCSNEKTADEYLQSAQASLQQGKKSEAIISLKNLLKNDLNNVEGRFLLGKAYALQGNWLAAEKELNRAQKYNYDSQLLYPLLAYVYSHLEDSSGIELLLKEIVDDKKLEQSLKYFMGIAFISEEEEFRALSAFTDVVEFDVDSEYGQLGQAWLYRLSDKFDEAINITNQLIEGDINIIEAMEVKANVLFMANEMEAAAEQFNSYLKLRPQDHKNRLFYALSLANTSNLAEAEKQADLLFQIFPNNALLNQIKSQVMFSNKDITQAKEFAEKALYINKNLVVARIIAGVTSFELNQPEAAYSHLVLIGDKLSYKNPVKRLLSTLRIQLGYEGDGIEDLLSTSEDDLDVDFLTLSAKKMFDVGKYQEAKALMNKAKIIEPENAELSYLQGMFASEESDELAESYFIESLEKDPNLASSVVMLVMSNLKKGEIAESLNVAQSIKETNPILSYTLQGIIYKKNEEYNKARHSFKQILMIDENNVGAMSNIASLLELEGKTELAIDIYVKTLKINSTHIPAIMRLLMLSTQAEYQETINVFFKSQAQVSDNSMMYIALINFYIMNENMPLALDYTRVALNKFPDDIKLLLIEGKILLNTNRSEDAMVKFEHVIKLQKENVSAYVLKANTLIMQNKLDEAIKVQRELVEIDPKELKFRLRLAQFYYDNKEVNEAHAMLNSLSKKEKGSTLYARLKGKFSFIEKDYQTAIMYLDKVYNKQPSKIVLLELVQSLQYVGNVRRALLLIDDLEVREGKLNNLTLKLKRAEMNASIYPDIAIAQYEELLNEGSQKFIIYNNMAMIFLDKGDFNQALEKINLAINLKPNVIQVQHSKGKVLLKMGRALEALTFLEKAHSEYDKNNGYIIDYAIALYEVGRKKEAFQLLEMVNINTLTVSEKNNFTEIKNKQEL